MFMTSLNINNYPPQSQNQRYAYPRAFDSRSVTTNYRGLRRRSQLLLAAEITGPLNFEIIIIIMSTSLRFLASKAVSRNIITPVRSQVRSKSAIPDVTSLARHHPSSNTAIKSNAETVPLVSTFLTMTAGVLTVSGAAAAVEVATADQVPPFDPLGQRFDQSTFLGRFSKMILACDPRLLLFSEGETRRCKSMVENFQSLLQNIPEGATEQEMHRALWEAQRVAGAALHPDTGDVIPHPFRMSGYVPFNGPICVAMVASTSTPALLFWSWVNQSQNALVNYYNRNASAEMSNATLVKSYTIAVASALTVAFGLATYIQRYATLF